MLIYVYSFILISVLIYYGRDDNTYSQKKTINKVSNKINTKKNSISKRDLRIVRSPKVIKY